MSTVPGPAPFRFSLRHEAITFGGVVERNWYLIKRYFWWELAFFVWSLANTLTIVFIAKGIKAAGGHIDVNRATTTLLIGAVRSARARATFCCMPRDRCSIPSCRRSVGKPTRPRISGIFRLVSRGLSP